MDSEAQQTPDFLLATRTRYELQQRTCTGEAERQPARSTELDEDRELRAADFLVATRTMHEVNARNLDRRVRHRREQAEPPQP